MLPTTDSQRFGFLAELTRFLEQSIQQGYWIVVTDPFALEIDTRTIINLRQNQKWLQLEQRMFHYEIELLVAQFHAPEVTDNRSTLRQLADDLEQNNRVLCSAFDLLNYACQNHFSIIKRVVEDRDRIVSQLNEHLSEPLPPVKIPEFSEFTTPTLHGVGIISDATDCS